MEEEQKSTVSSSRRDVIITRTTDVIRTVCSPVNKLLNKIIPVFEPRINLEERLVGNESIKEHAIIRHYSEIQIVLGLLLIPVGFMLQGSLNTPYLLVLSILGILLFVTGYEIEEIYISSHRIFIRRIGMVERIIRVPSDEDHSLEHLVSFNIGRAPANLLLVGLSILFYLVVFNDQIPEIIQLIVVVPATIILFYGLRIKRRAVTLHLAGGLNILLGVRKGVPKRIVNAIQSAMYNDQENNQSTKVKEIDKEKDNINDEKPAK